MSDTSVVVVEIDGGTTVIEVPGAVEVVEVGSFGDPGPAGPTGPAGAPGAPGDWATAQPFGWGGGPSYTVVAADAGKLVASDATTITLPSGVLAAGQRIDFVATVPSTFVLGAGATWWIPPTPSAVARAVGSMVTAVKMTATTWALTGDLAG